MIWSVSMFSCGTRTALDVNFTGHLPQFPNIRNTARNCACRSRQRRREQRAPALALASFKVSIAGADRRLARLELIAVHRETHAASRFTPLGTGVLENLVETFRLCGFLDLIRTGNN